MIISNPRLEVTSRSFKNGGAMMRKNTGFGEDISPDFILSGIDPDAESIAIIMDDLDIPFIKSFNHWLIWDIPITEEIPEAIPHGETVPSLGGASQGIAYGKNRYRGPKQPFFIRNTHRYRFRIYTLDCMLKLPPNIKKAELLFHMDQHIIQQVTITGRYKR